MLVPLIHVALVLHANLLGNVDGGHVLRGNQGNQAREAELLQSIVFEGLRPFQRQASLPVLWCQHIAQFHLWLPIYLLHEESALPNKTLVALLNSIQEGVSVDLIFSDIPVQDMLHLLFAVRPTQEAHHFGIGIQGCQLVQVREHQWSEQQMFCLDNNQSLLMHRLLMSFLNQAFPEETGKKGILFFHRSPIAFSCTTALLIVDYIVRSTTKVSRCQV